MSPTKVASSNESASSSFAMVNGTPKTARKATKRKGVNGEASTLSAAPSGRVVVAEAASSSTDPSTSTSSPIPAASKYLDSLTQHNAAFTCLLHLIPPQFYLTRDDHDDMAAEHDTMSSKYMKNKRKKAKSEIEAKERKEKMREAKKQRLDPDSSKDVTSLQAERAAANAARQAAEKDWDVETSANGMVSDGDPAELGQDQHREQVQLKLQPNGVGAGGADDDLPDSDTDDTRGRGAATNTHTLSDAKKPIRTEGERKASIEVLRAKLHAKIAGLQRKRGGLLNAADEASEDGASIASSKEELLEERRKQRRQARERKAEKKKEAKATAVAKKAATAANAQGGTTSANGKMLNVATKAPVLLVDEPKYGGKGASASSGANIDVNGASLNFSSLDFERGGAARAAIPGGKNNKLALPSDPKAALQVLGHRKKAEEAKKAKLAEKLGADAREVCAKLDEEKQWNKVVASASGVKIRDDEKLLKKAAKKKEKQKEKSSKAWNERQQNEVKQQAARQKRRTDNVAARKIAKGNKGNKASSSTLSASKTPKAKKRSFGKARPGFEGKKIGRGKK